MSNVITAIMKAMKLYAEGMTRVWEKGIVIGEQQNSVRMARHNGTQTV